MFQRVFLLPVLSLTLLLVGCSASYSLTEAELNEYVTDRTLSQTIGAPGLFELAVDMSDVDIKLGEPSTDQMRASGNMDLVLKALGSQQEASLKVDFAASPRYEPEEGALYVQNLELLGFETMPENYAQQLEPFMPQLISIVEYFLQSQPVYVLDEKDKDQLMARKVLKEVVISPGKLTFKASP